MESSFRGEELCGESHQAGDETVVVLSDWVPHRDTNSSISPTASPEKKIRVTSRLGGECADGDSGLSGEKISMDCPTLSAALSYRPTRRRTRSR